ncbi:MAG: hypothetical protein AAF993_19095 [Pseudomonadota bacterium]
MTNVVIAMLIAVVAAASACTVYLWFGKRRTAQTTARVTRALTLCQAIYTALEHIPDGIISRDLRRGLVLLLTNHLNVLAEANPKHPILPGMQRQVQKLNKIPSGFERERIRDKQTRRYAALALEQLAKILREAVSRRELDTKHGDLARASATFTAQQIAVENARQAAKDAENVGANKKALNFAYQAQSLCRSLPPLMGKALAESVATDIERLEGSLKQPLRT